MSDRQHHISKSQFFFFIVQTQIGVGVLSLPYDLHTVAKQDGWISLLGACLILQIVIIFFWILTKRFPNDDLLTFNEFAFGKIIGRIINFTYTIYFLAISALVLILYSEILNIWILPETPSWVLILLMIIIGTYLVSSSISVIARIYTFLSAFIVVLVILLVYVLPHIDLIYLFPIGKQGVTPIIKGMHSAGLSFMGFIIVLFISKYVRANSKQKLATMSAAIWFVFGIYAFTVFVSFTFFGTVEIDLIPQPVLYMLKAFELPVVARIDLLFLTIWIVSVATSFGTFLYLANISLKATIQAKKRGWVLGVCSVIIFLICVIPPINAENKKTYTTWITNADYFFSVAFPLIILVASIILRKKLSPGGK
ncbi:hypothetical protein CEY16_11865 [Halalkalibacillus sediminis]|uniref:Uncharacterized protein n=1 Tax=Halalkalibacillus sediminis TaxID=2018042 RepID=A0A2I0QSY9_9BACI|nr:GerAB/ArcD/ProY family transporter [Halalkalibacillus sediminis]PKR77418.1 hypothetical protein CEY16_11865 [Halalkalibacillus sediminis]